MFNLMNQLTREDAEARADMFMSTLLEEIANDEEPYQKKCRQLARALLEKDAEGVIIALCGWSPRSIAMKSLLIRDTAQEFHDDDFIGSTLIVKYVNGDTAEGECTVNPATHEVKDFNPELFDNKYSAVDSVSVELGNDGECLLCYPEDEVAFDEDAYWYKPVVGCVEGPAEDVEPAWNWGFKPIAEIKTGDIVCYGSELYFATTNAYLTDTAFGREWNFQVCGGTKNYLYATNFENAECCVLLPDAEEFIFNTTAAFDKYAAGYSVTSATVVAEMVYAINNHLVILSLLTAAEKGDLEFVCKHISGDKDVTNRAEYNGDIASLSKDALETQMASICRNLCKN